MDATRLKFTFSIRTAHGTQMRMAKQIVFEDELPEKIRFVAGIDVAYTQGIAIGAVAVLDYDSLKLVESQTACCKSRFPYIPTLLAFREIPPAILSIKKLQVHPDVFLVDGHGVAHPYQCGFASHLGLVMRKPTIGVAKRKLFGKIEKNKDGKNFAFITHNGAIVGLKVITKSGSKPIYVSVGHMVSLNTSRMIVNHCTRSTRVPKPILKAHETAKTEKRKINIQ